VNSVIHILGWIFLALGWVLAFLGSAWIMDYCPCVAAEHSLGLVCFLVPIVQFVYVAAHWKESKEGFFIQISGLMLMLLAALAGVPGS
jgi:hypothetical protein